MAGRGLLRYRSAMGRAKSPQQIMLNDRKAPL
jgi:hypothetical protein